MGKGGRHGLKDCTIDMYQHGEDFSTKCDLVSWKMTWLYCSCFFHIRNPHVREIHVNEDIKSCVNICLCQPGLP